MYFRSPVTPEPNRFTCLRGALLAIVAVCLTGCLYTTHHFNTGRILEPGETSVALGYGKAHFLEEGCPDNYYQYQDSQDSAGRPDICRLYENDFYTGAPQAPSRADTVVPIQIKEITTPKFSLGYRLGVRKQWGPLTGIELGWTMEAPTNPVTVEFDLKAGLPLPGAWKAAAHSVTGGWGIGMWSDNTWFLEYAASWVGGKHTLYGNYRWSNLATQPQDLESSFDDWKFIHRRRLINQASAGWIYRLPEMVILPDYIGPQGTVTTPMLLGLSDASPATDRAFDFNINWVFGWTF
jgi:hypothetical protein